MNEYLMLWFDSDGGLSGAMVLASADAVKELMHGENIAVVKSHMVPLHLKERVPEVAKAPNRRLLPETYYMVIGADGCEYRYAVSVPRRWVWSGSNL